MKHPDISLILPCYNEESLLTQSVDKIIRILDLSRLSYEVIFVDDKSADNTSKILKSLCRKNSKLHLTEHKNNLGRGRAVVNGMKAARGLVVGYIDIDLEVSPVYIVQMADMIARGDADIVLGKRVYRTTFFSIPREIFSKGYTYLTEKILNTGSVDTESGYKFFHRKKILPVLSKTSHPHWFWDTEIVVFAKLAGLKIVEVPVLYLRRFDKKSSVRVIPDIMDYLVNLWKLRRRLTNK